jgi:hypothetical protein
MALAARIKEEVFAELSEEIQKEYIKQDDGTYQLDVTPVDGLGLDDATNLKSALSKERTARETAEKKLKGFADLDADKARDAIKKVEAMVNWKPDEKVKEQIEAVKNQLTEKHKTEVDKLQQKLERRYGQLQKVMIDAEAIKAINEHGGSTKSASVLLYPIRENTRMKETDKGEFVVEVIGNDGNSRISPASRSTAPMSISELVAEMKNDEAYSPLFNGSGATGSGAAGGGVTKTKLGVHLISREDARDPQTYRAAKEAAKKAGTTLQIQEA